MSSFHFRGTFPITSGVSGISEEERVIVLKCQDQFHSKVYYAYLKKETEGWMVFGYYGRIGKPLQRHVKNQVPIPFYQASEKFWKLVDSKVNKGYVIVSN